MSVTINTLWPYADGGFRDAIVEGLRRSLAAGHRPFVRWLAGTPFLYSLTGAGPEAVRDQVLAALAPAASDLPMVVATTTSGLTSWNHSKIVAVDGRQAIVGGHNQWAADYLSDTPVSDVSMLVRGPAAAAATRYADVTWGYVCDRRAEGFLSALIWTRYSATAAAGSACPRTTPVLDPGTPGTTRVLAVGKLGNGIAAPTGPADGRSSIPTNPLNDLCGPYGENRDFLNRNPGLVANRELIASADHEVFIAQQDLLGTCPRYDQELFRILAKQLLAGVKVTIVVSGAFFTAYSQMLSPFELSRTIFLNLLNQSGDLFRSRDAMCADLRLATVRVGPDATWPGGVRFAQHAKFIEVDDQVFKVGSNNLYPASLQEYDFVVDDAAAAAQVRQAYLDPLWRWSSADAIIDAGQGRCDIFGL